MMISTDHEKQRNDHFLSVTKMSFNSGNVDKIQQGCLFNTNNSINPKRFFTNLKIEHLQKSSLSSFKVSEKAVNFWVTNTSITHKLQMAQNMFKNNNRSFVSKPLDEQSQTVQPQLKKQQSQPYLPTKEFSKRLF